MKRIICLSLFIISVSASLWGQSLLPLPRQVNWLKGTFNTELPYRVQKDSKISFVTNGCAGNWLGKPDQKGPQLLIFCYDAQLPSEESYMLKVLPDTLQVTARSAAGFQYACATLRQLCHNGKIPCCHIVDTPAFEWRGVMIDVSRHFFPIAFLKKQVDIMASFKLNRLHLHLTDAAGWRMEIKRYPRLTSFAAWRTEALWKDWWMGERAYVEAGSPDAYGGYYTQEELRDLVEYAASKNVLIVPEIEMPAHSEEVLTAYPELSCTHEPYKQADFCPGNIATYDFLEHVLEEVMEVFPSPYIHIGGDEAGKASWSSCPRCQKKMKEEGLNSVNELQTYLVRHMGNFLRKNGRQLLGWDEIVAPGLPDGTNVMVWRDIKHAQEAIAQGYNVVLSPGSHCYLDAYQDAPDTQPEAIGGFLSLEKVYGFEPLDGLTREAQTHVLGVQANLWTEYVPTTAHAEYMLYPRLLAISEVAWNGKAVATYADFRNRALHASDLLRCQGVHVFDLRQEIGNRPAALKTVNHKAVGSKVIYNRPVNPYYPGQGATTLVDGVRGGWHHGDGKWQGFIGKDCVDITIDLGKRMTFRRVSTDFLQYVHPDIFFPGEYTIAVSDDNLQFREIYHKCHQVSKSPAVAAEEWTWKGKEKARFIRINADRGALSGWIFIDEILVR